MISHAYVALTTKADVVVKLTFQVHDRSDEAPLPLSRHNCTPAVPDMLSWRSGLASGVIGDIPHFVSSDSSGHS